MGTIHNNKEYISEVACDWVTSKTPLGTAVLTTKGSIRKISAGHTKHEWTSYSAIDSIFKYIEKKYEKRSGCWRIFCKPQVYPKNVNINYIFTTFSHLTLIHSPQGQTQTIDLLCINQASGHCPDVSQTLTSGLFNLLFGTLAHFVRVNHIDGWCIALDKTKVSHLAHQWRR